MSDTEDAECANSTISRRRSERHSSRTSTLGSTAEVTIAQSGWVSWMLRRMGLLEKVEGCYKTEAEAFRKAVEMLDSMDTAVAGQQIFINPTL
ncbi:unnamed protein product, partial [Sphacelaria rigidula]